MGSACATRLASVSQVSTGFAEPTVGNSDWTVPEVPDPLGRAGDRLGERDGGSVHYPPDGRLARCGDQAHVRATVCALSSSISGIILNSNSSDPAGLVDAVSCRWNLRNIAES